MENEYTYEEWIDLTNVIDSHIEAYEKLIGDSAYHLLLMISFCNIKEAKEYTDRTILEQKTESNEIGTLTAIQDLIFGDIRNVPLYINYPFKEIVSWRLQHGR